MPEGCAAPDIDPPHQRQVVGVHRAAGRRRLHQSAEGLRYDHILLAILDSNPSLSSSSRAALATAASLAGANGSKLSVCFIDQEGARVNGQRLEVVQGELARRELEVGGWGVGG